MTEAYKTKNRETTHKRKKTKKGYGKKYCLGLSTLFVCYLVFFVSLNTSGEKKTFRNGKQSPSNKTDIFYRKVI